MLSPMNKASLFTGQVTLLAKAFHGVKRLRRARIEVRERGKFKMGKFLFITTKGDWGGSEPLWCEAAGRALAEGHRVTVVLPQVVKLARPVEELASNGATLVMRPPRARPTILWRLEWKARGIHEPETQWWRSKFPEPFDAICVSQGGAYCVMNMPGLANWLMEIDTPFVLVGHSHRAYALPSIEIRPRIRDLFVKAYRVCFDASAHVVAAKRYLAIEFRGLAVQNPVNLPEAGRAGDRRSEIGDRVADGSKLVPSSSTGDALDPRRSTLDATAPEALMACVARFEVRDKGQDLLLEALGDPVWRDRDFRLDFFGSGPDR